MFIRSLLTDFFTTLFVKIKSLLTEYATHPYTAVKWKHAGKLS